MTDRVGSEISYTNNWPPEELVDNKPTSALILWTGFSVIMLIAVVVMAFLNRGATVILGCILFGTWLLCWAIVRVQVRRQSKLAQAPPPEVRISAHALLLGDQLHVWSGWGNRLEKCDLDKNEPPQIAITYSTPGGRGSRPTQTVCVPIPAGREAEAAALVQRLAARN